MTNRKSLCLKSHGSKERVLKYIDFKGISVRKFCKITGLSYSIFGSGNNFGTDKVSLIIDEFPDLSPEWLLTGRGSMLRGNKETHDTKTAAIPSERIKAIMDHYSLSQNSFSKQIGLADNSTIAKIISEKRTPNTRTLKRITDRFPEINSDWILTGRGEMLRKEEADSQPSLSKVPQLRYGQLQSSTQSLNYKGRGVPFYDVDFIGGFQYIFNDQTVQPISYIDIPIFNEADAWVNVTGDSMNPFINSGDIVAIKKLINWNEFILYGEIYGIVTEDFRTIKIIKEEEEGCFLLTPYNQSQEFKAQRIPKNLIMHIFKVIGCVKRIF